MKTWVLFHSTTVGKMPMIGVSMIIAKTKSSQNAKYRLTTPDNGFPASTRELRISKT